MRQFVSFSVVSALCCIFAGSAFSEIVFLDDFEGVPGVTMPSTEDDADPMPLVAGTYLWTNAEIAPSDIQVVNNATPGPVGGTNYLHGYRSGAAALLRGNFVRPASESLTMEFDIYIPETGANGVMLLLANSDTATVDVTTEVARLQFMHTGQLLYFNPATAATTLGLFSKNTWVHIKIDGFDYAAGTYDITVVDPVRGTAIYPDNAFRTTQTQLKQFTFYSPNTGAEWYLDNILVEDALEPPAANVTVFADDFEDADAVAWPDTLSDADPVAQVGLWKYVTEVSRENIQVTNNASPGPRDGENYLVVDRSSNYAYVIGTFAYPAGPSTVIAEFDIYMPSGGNGDQGCWFNLYNSTLNDYALSKCISRTILRHNGIVTNYNSAGSGTNLITLPLNTWIHVKLVYDFDSQTFSLRLNGAQFNNLGFVSPQESITQIALQAAPPNTRFYIDNVSVRAAQVCPFYSRYDFNEDCAVDVYDLETFMTEWLDCNLEPQSLCY